MPSFRSSTVVEIIASRVGLQRLRLSDGSGAIALTQVVGDVAVGDDVVVNTTAVELGLGTGGWHVVQWNLARRELHQPGPGHIMKVRYTGGQLDTGAAEEVPGAVHAGIPHLGGVPILVGSLHSQMGVAAQVVHHLDPTVRISYVMTDGAALPLVISDLVAALSERGVLTGTITAGHAFGGDLEAVSVPSALQVALEVQRADVVICTMGPGVVGTATALGTTAVEVAGILTAAHQLGGHPVMMLRASEADHRPRHLGVSHHSRTALTLTPVAVDVPHPGELTGILGAINPHRAIPCEGPDIATVLDHGGVAVTSMGRGHRDDPLFFRTVGSAAAHATKLRGAEGTVCAE